MIKVGDCQSTIPPNTVIFARLMTMLRKILARAIGIASFFRDNQGTVSLKSFKIHNNS